MNKFSTMLNLILIICVHKLHQKIINVIIKMANNTNTSLAFFPLIDASRYFDLLNEDGEILTGRSPKNNNLNIVTTIITIIISALIFISIIAVFDVIKKIITNYYAEKTLKDPNLNNDTLNINRTFVANQQSLNSNIIFCLLSIFITFTLVPFLVYNYLQ